MVMSNKINKVIQSFQKNGVSNDLIILIQGCIAVGEATTDETKSFLFDHIVHPVLEDILDNGIKPASDCECDELFQEDCISAPSCAPVPARHVSGKGLCDAIASRTIISGGFIDDDDSESHESNPSSFTWVEGDEPEDSYDDKDFEIDKGVDQGKTTGGFMDDNEEVFEDEASDELESILNLSIISSDTGSIAKAVKNVSKPGSPFRMRILTNLVSTCAIPEEKKNEIAGLLNQ